MEIVDYVINIDTGLKNVAVPRKGKIRAKLATLKLVRIQKKVKVCPLMSTCFALEMWKRAIVWIHLPIRLKVL